MDTKRQPHACPHCQAGEPSVWDDVLFHYAHPAGVKLKVCHSPWRERCRRCSGDVPGSVLLCTACIRALPIENDRLRAEVARLTKLLPHCLGAWTGGSGGHRKYAGGCSAPGVWDVGLGFVCDEHKNKNGGDDDAWRWEDEEEKLRGEVDRLSKALVDAYTAVEAVTAERDRLRAEAAEKGLR
jgi:hypothetical protein